MIPISPDVAKRAADDYLVIARAGMLEELRREIDEAVAAHEAAPVSRSPMGEWSDYHARCAEVRGTHLRYSLERAADTADDLAELLGCPTEAVEPYIVPAVIREPLRRSFVLDCLRNMAQHIRRQGRPARRAS